MNLSPADLGKLADIAIAAATEASLMIARSRPRDIQHKAGADSIASQVVTDIDRRSEDIILGHLVPTLERFELAVLTEEQPDDGGRLVADHFWCVDPLDGTLPFIEGTPGYAVSIALVRRDGTPLIGVVADPVDAAVLHAVSGGGAFRNGEPWPRDASATPDVLSVFADRSFLTMRDHDDIIDALERIAQERIAERRIAERRIAASRIAARRGGSRLRVDATRGAVMNACGVLANAPACYLKFPAPTGGGNLWDFAATACLFHEAGGVATDIHGDALDLNRPTATNMSHRGILFASDASLAAQLRELRPS